ncbi:MAG: DUF4291 domain-containing protein [Planctomycetaceae bacterium]|nr:DUF4291 domain-containing protein [Planctomycetaceae bacterium]
MPDHREIRADYDRTTIVVYQAYNDAIADAALAAGRFVPPFSLGRMTWIKPSFLWLMERSGWATKSNQERILAVRITRAGWDQALAAAVLTSFDPAVHRSADAWREQFAQATVHVQWDPERSIEGKKLDFRSIQVGLSRAVIHQYVSSWTQEITDLTPLATKLRELRRAGKHSEAKRHLPPARVYPTDAATAARLGMNS